MNQDDQSIILPVLPLDDAVVLPGTSVTFPVTSDDQAEALDGAVDGRFLLVPRIDGRFMSHGVVATIVGEVTLPDGTRGVAIEAVHRAELGPAIGGESGLRVSAVERPDPDDPGPEAAALAREYRAVVEEVADLRGDRVRVAHFLAGISHPGRLADTAGYAPEIPLTTKAELLGTVDVVARLRLAIDAQRERLADAGLRRRIREDVTDGLDKSQREMLLRRQLSAIRKELGEDPEDGDDWSERIAASAMPDAARKEAERELARLERQPEGAEAGMIRTYLEWMVSLPWGTRSEEELDVAGAREVLDADHAGLQDIKERILEYLSVRRLRRERGMDEGRSGVILTLVGPPGTGKTSLGQSVAKALGREFARISLGGIRDEAEVRGHRRTYVGALPGRLVRALREAGTMNPVIMLDEIDKVGADWRGDPSSALLEVLDPAQNHSFRDHYLDVELDLSEVLFIATANVADTIPGPLLDRMEVIALDGYTEDEKLQIARGYLLPRQVERNGLREDEVTVDDDALRAVIGDYTREAGVRSLERELGKVLRKAARRVAEGAEGPITIGPGDLHDALGRPRFHHEAAERTAIPGVATGLAVTGTGGDVLFVEASAMTADGPGERLVLTGQLGDVMRESARIALSWTRAHGTEVGIHPADLAGKEVHVHVPAGAIPKDGPSAGVTMITAIASLASGRAVRPNVGMTGEVTLQGRVLPIGGLKQKVLAAHRAGLTDVIIPERNRRDLDDVPAEILEQVTVHPVLTIREVLDIALEPAHDRHESIAA
ncbi:endopeptidase La [Miltoncostaea oceani]|jgi:ATP-dependent Lon protease|uniref:endopeptidase La n=1 Tax=Miltoncostaea oceani TaxID=2843216 RepID=UPI001C3D7681|nr:endopeptidase La [Miltoncostaea oceani]